MKTVEAVYEHGVLRPSEPLDLPEGAKVRVSLSKSGTPAGRSPRGHTAEEDFAIFAARLVRHGDVEVPSEDHDHYLYGARRKSPGEKMAKCAAEPPVSTTPPAFTARDLTDWMQRRATAGALLDEEALDRLDAAQATPRRSPDRWAEAGER